MTVKSPRNYSQWLNFFEKLKTENPNNSFFDGLSEGACPSFDIIADSYCTRLTETVNVMLLRSVKHISKQINQCFEDGELDYAETVLRRGSRELKKCYFFQKLSFLPDEFISNLTAELDREINRYWNEIYKNLVALDNEVNSVELNDFMYYVGSQLRRAV